MIEVDSVAPPPHPRPIGPWWTPPPRVAIPSWRQGDRRGYGIWHNQMVVDVKKRLEKETYPRNIQQATIRTTTLVASLTCSLCLTTTCHFGLLLETESPHEKNGEVHMILLPAIKGHSCLEVTVSGTYSRNLGRGSPFSRAE